MSYTSSLGYTPLFRIDRNGQDITSAFEDRTTSVKVTSVDGGGEGDQLEIVLDDREFAIASPSTGESDATVLTVYLGYREGGLYEQGTFTAKEITYSGPPRSMTIIGSSFGFTNGGKSPLIKSFENKTLGDIIDDIAAATGATASIAPALASKVIPYLHQHASSLHLLQELERRYDGLAKFQDGVLSFTERGSGQNVSGQGIGGFVFTPPDFGNWSITESERSAYSKVRASYWDKVNHQLVWLESQKKAASDSSQPFLLKRALPTKDEAQAAADAMMSKLNRGLRQGVITLAKGDPSIRAGMGFAISGMRDGVDGASFIINQATHTFDCENGLMTTIEFRDTGDGQDFTSDTLANGEQPTVGEQQDDT